MALPSRKTVLALLIGLLALTAACADAPEPVEVTREVTRVVAEEAPDTPEPIEVTRIIEQVVEVTAQPVATATPAPLKSLVVCLVHEPDSLYLYDAAALGSAAFAAQSIRHAVYEDLFTTRSFGYQPQGLVKLPSLEDGDARIDRVTVRDGERVADANGAVVTLVDGTTLLDADGDRVVFEGGEIDLAQMVVTFELQPLVWSDGIPVTADDSVFSYELAAAPLTPVSKERIVRTARYEATGERSLQWTGVPGWVDPVFFTNVWAPLPRHQLGELTPAEILSAAEATRRPLSNGPFVIESWTPGDEIALSRNDFYYRADEGYPLLDRLSFKFVPNSDQLVARLLSGQCDVATQDGLDATRVSLLLEAEQSGVLVPYFQVGTVFEHIDFGINPEEVYAAQRPDWFEDVRVRQALTLCTDRPRMVQELFLGFSDVAHAYVPDNHPLLPQNLARWDFDPAAGQALLEEANVIDRDNDGIREEPLLRTPLQLTLTYNNSSEVRQKAVTIFQENMADCGVEVTLQALPAPELFDPRGPVFGREFELVVFPWLSGVTPPCELYTSGAIPTAENKWQGNNNTGWRDEAFDAACAQAGSATWNSADYVLGHQQALRLFAENVPVIPLFAYLNVAAAQAHVLNYDLDPTQPSELWNLYEIDVTMP